MKREHGNRMNLLSSLAATGALVTALLCAPVAIGEPPEDAMRIDDTTVKQGAAPYRGWHYHPRHVFTRVRRDTIAGNGCEATPF